ncbi:MFS transporter [Streptomyces halobius]|uniref:MFS transporter n=1 Tax=Streptomyces halobius TaxID=2879846 RepID=A0ABY4M3X8_9ACTN|nr:MFS transporter [Streptomyces halobius]UQA92430.1 MFS transporter [Streptomyces halobius]
MVDTTTGAGAPSPVSATAGTAELAPGTRAYRRAITALFAAGVAVFLLLYVTQGLLPEISDELRITPAEASLTVSATTAAIAIALLPLSALSEKYGRTRVMTASVFTASVIGLALPFVTDLGAFVALRALQGVALAGLPATAMAYLAEEVSPKAVSSAIGLYLAGNSIGGMSSRFVAGLVAQWSDWRVSLGVLGVIALCCAVVFRLTVPRAANFRSVPVNPGAVARTVSGHLRNPLLLRLYFLGALFMVVFGAVFTVLGYRLSAAPFGLPEGVIGAFFLIYLVGTVTSTCIGRFAERFGRRTALYAGMAVASAGVVVTVVNGVVAIVAGLVLVTVGFFTGHVIASSSVSSNAATGRAQASAVYLTIYYIGNSIGGTLAASAYHGAGWTGVVVVCLASMGLAALIAVRRI